MSIFIFKFETIKNRSEGLYDLVNYIKREVKLRFRQPINKERRGVNQAQERIGKETQIHADERENFRRCNIEFKLSGHINIGLSRDQERKDRLKKRNPHYNYHN